MTVNTTSFSAGSSIPEKFCFHRNGHSGENISPQISWTGAPEGTESYALIVEDPDGGNWSHWILYDIPPTKTSLDEGFNKHIRSVKQGRISSGAYGYEGPYPPAGTHSYLFRVFALDTTLHMPPREATFRGIKSAMSGHILAEADLVGKHSAHG